MQKQKVLFIEDDEQYRKIYKHKFELSGFAVEVAENGAIGIEKVRTFAPDLIFLDLKMPEMNGIEVLDALKADPQLAAIPVIILTNLSTSHDVEVAIQKGASTVLTKSDTEPDDIVEVAREKLKQQAS